VSTYHPPSNRPDLVLFDYQKKSILFIEVSCPTDTHVLSKENEKLQKYRPLAHDFKNMYQMSVEVIPIVIGHSGVISSRCQSFLQCIPGFCNSLLCHLLKAAILRTIHTLQTVNI